MSNTEQVVQVTVKLPKEIYERVARTAAGEQQQLEDLLSVLVTEGLDAHGAVRELFEHVSAQYRARLAREGKLDQSADEVLQELGTLREQIASELYPT
jgi:uncharacterized membrane protein YheB (UPF0754 family)